MDFMVEHSVVDGYMGLGHKFGTEIVRKGDTHLSNFIMDLV